MADTTRIEELRRRVENDPASIAFAQLAEEFRRTGAYDEAVRVCRAGLSRHPSYLSARVTLGRALVELQRYDEARAELDLVLRSAPENLAAIRGLAEIHQRQGNLTEALRHYQIALALARHDPELEESVLDLNRRLGTDATRTASSRADAGNAPTFASEDANAPPPLNASSPAGTQLEERRVPDPPRSETPVVPLSSLSPELEAAADEFTKALQALDALSLDLPSSSLPESPPVVDAAQEEQDSTLPPHGTSDLPDEDQAAVDELESWLEAILRDRAQRNSA